MNRSTPGLPVHHQLPDFTQSHVHRVGNAIQPSDSSTRLTWTVLPQGFRDTPYLFGQALSSDLTAF